MGEEAPRRREGAEETEPLQDLLNLAREVIRLAPDPKMEAKSEMELLATRELKDREEDAFRIGGFEYLASAGNWQKLDKEGGGHMDPRYRSNSTFVYIGHNSTWNLNRVPGKPQDYLEALDQAGANIEKNMTEAGNPVDIDAFYRERADDVLFSVREDIENNLKRKIYMEPRVVYVRDLPKEVAWKLFAQNVYGPITGRAYLGELRLFLKKNLEGFTEAALEQDDLATAIEGYHRLGTLAAPEVVKKIKEGMERLHSSKNPNDKRRLELASRQLLHFQ